MTHSVKAVNLISGFEGLVLKAYQDQNGIWTIGYGHTRNVHAGDICTAAQALIWLGEDIQTADSVINDLVKVPLTQDEFDGLVSLVYNIGYGHFLNSTVLKQLNLSNYRRAGDAFAMWNQTNGKVNPGLVRRREAEMNVYFGVN